MNFFQLNTDKQEYSNNNDRNLSYEDEVWIPEFTHVQSYIVNIHSYVYMIESRKQDDRNTYSNHLDYKLTVRIVNFQYPIDAQIEIWKKFHHMAVLHGINYSMNK